MRELLIRIAQVVAPFKVEVHEIEMIKPPAVHEFDIIDVETRA